MLIINWLLLKVYSLLLTRNIPTNKIRATQQQKYTTITFTACLRNSYYVLAYFIIEFWPYWSQCSTIVTTGDLRLLVRPSVTRHKVTVWHKRVAKPTLWTGGGVWKRNKDKLLTGWKHSSLKFGFTAHRYKGSFCAKLYIFIMQENYDQCLKKTLINF